MQFTQGHALVIGVGTYQHLPAHAVPLTADDAHEVAAVLQDRCYCGYQAEQIQLLTREHATRANVLKALDALATRTGPDDTALVFYSGHGAYGVNGYYLTTHDTQLAGNQVVTDTAVRDVELLERLRRLPAQRALFIFNACHSGELSPSELDGAEQAGTDAGRNLPDDVSVALLGTGAGRVVITACRAQQKSYFVKNRSRTLFTTALVEALRGQGVTSRHGYISVFDLYHHVFSTINTYVRDTWGLAQEPMLTISRGVGVMAVGLYRGAQPAADATAIPAPATLGGVVRAIDPAESQQRLLQFLNGNINLAAGRDTIVGGNQQINAGTGLQNNYGNVDSGGAAFVHANISTAGGALAGRDQHMHGDKIAAEGAQGFVNRPQGPISQNFGSQHTIQTGGGEYVQGNLDKRQGAFISGGTVFGPVIGSNSGSVTTNYQGLGSGRTNTTGLRQVLDRVRQFQQLARQQGDDDLSEDLNPVVSLLEAAVKADADGKPERRAEKLRDAQQTVRRMAHTNIQVNELAAELERVT